MKSKKYNTVGRVSKLNIIVVERGKVDTPKISVTVSVSVQDFSVLFKNDVHPVICESWQFSHMWKALA
jgi:hypothetical protein